MSYDILETRDGLRYSTGLLCPQYKMTPLFSSYGQSQKVLTRPEIIQILQDKRRTPARERFPYDVWGWDQNGIGSCNGQAAAGCLSKSRAALGHEPIQLSGEGVYALINGGQDQGSYLDAGMKALTEIGAFPRTLFPRNDVYLKQNFPQEVWDHCSRFRIEPDGAYFVEGELEMASAICLGYFLVVAVHAGPDYGKLDKNWISPPNFGYGNHAVECDDCMIIDGELVFESPNSWGKRFGVNGRNRLTYGKHFKSTNHKNTFYAVRSVTTDPQGQNPPKVLVS